MTLGRSELFQNRSKILSNSKFQTPALIFHHLVRTFELKIAVIKIYSLYIHVRRPIEQEK